MVSIKITGKILDIFPTEEITEKFSKRLVWVEEDAERYASSFEVEFLNRAGEELDTFKLGDSVTIEEELRGRKGVTKKGEERIYMSVVGKTIYKTRH